MKKPLFPFLVLGISAFSSNAVFGASTPPAATSILSVNDVKDNAIIYPESFETDVQKMMESWYLKNYTVSSDKSASRSSSSTNYTDQDYIDRLSTLPTEIEMPYNQVVRSYINMYVERKRGLVENMLGMSLYYMPIFEQALDKYGLPLELKYLPIIESALNPNAVSSAGATGLWQFMLSTATGLGVEVNSLIDQRRDPYVASDAAARYLKQLFNTYHDWSLAIAAYNCGPGNVNKALRRAGGGKKDFWEIYPYLPAETRGYVPGFIAANYAMNYYDKHNIKPVLAKKPIVTDTIHVTKRVHLQQISDVLNIPMDELRILNPQFRKDIIPGDIKSYALILPSMQTYCYIASEDSIVNHNADLYARRLVVEPNDGKRTVSEDGEYVEEMVVKYHKVHRNETLNSIAKKYGVSANSIRKTNKIGRKVKQGQTLRINTYTRRFIPKTDSPAATQPSDSTLVLNANGELVDSLGNIVTPAPSHTEAPKSQTETTKSQQSSTSKASSSKPQTHTIKSGETLSSISRKYGVTIDQLKSANGLKNENIQIGQKLTIPSKGGYSSKSSKSSSKSKSRKKRRR